MPRDTPSTRWTSFESWDYNGMKERLELLLAKLDKGVLVRHAELITGQKFRMSQPFSAGQSWICFEMVAEDGSLVMARVRLPPHPGSLSTLSEEHEQDAISYELATMRFVRERLPSVTLPRVYAYEGPGSQLAADAGAIYMLIEGFYGNTLQDAVPDLCGLSLEQREHITAQWTMIQVSLATLTYPLIGSISSLTASGEPVIGKLSSIAADGSTSHGPFTEALDYFIALGEASLSRARSSRADNAGFSRFWELGALVFIDIVQSTVLFNSHHSAFPLNHMDLGTQNILVDDDLNFLAIIDWEFAQTAPWQVNHYPMPFPLLWSDEKLNDALADPEHIAHNNVKRQAESRQLYCEHFRKAEAMLLPTELADGGGFAGTLGSAASRLYTCFSRLGDVAEHDEDFVREMIRLAFGFDVDETVRYLEDMSHKL